MRRKIVLWGSNEKDERILVALELLEKENLVNIYTFPQGLATEQFYKDMNEKWRDDKEVEFPDGFSKIERKLSVTDSLLPDEIKVEKTDIITLAQAEWHFVVLSSKLYELYKSELEEIKDKVETATNFEGGMWDDLKTFWGKVQDQVNERNLFREHGAALREKTNGLFDKLKELRKSLEVEAEAKSKEYMDIFVTEIKDIEDKIEKGLGISPLFDELKKVQAKLNDFQFTRKDRDKVWNKIDEAFKKLKEKRATGRPGGSGQGAGSEHLTNRYNGLVAAMQKMQKSIDMDKKDLEFETVRVEKSDGQLESMLRQAKINMINERIISKEEKIADMNKTKAELESKMDRDKDRAARGEAKEMAKAKIAAEIEENSKAHESMSDALVQAANELSESKTKKKSDGTLLGSLAVSAAEFVSNISDAVEAVTEVIEDKLEDVLDTIEDKVEVAMAQAEVVIDHVEDKVEDGIDALKDKAKIADARKEEE